MEICITIYGIDDEILCERKCYDGNLREALREATRFDSCHADDGDYIMIHVELSYGGEFFLFGIDEQFYAEFLSNEELDILDDPEYADFIRCAKAKPHWGNKETGEVFVEFEKILNLLSEGSVFELDYCGNFPLMNGWLIAEFDKRGKEVRPGDKIMAKGILVTVAKVLAQDYYGGTWDVEFIDNAGNYRHWKSELDGGKVIYKE